MRLHSAIGSVALLDRLAGRADEVHAASDSELETARRRRAQLRATARAAA